MAMTSALIPPLAIGHWLRGQWRHRRVTPWPPPPAAVLFDRDGTLIRDVPYNGDPDRVEPMPGRRPRRPGCGRPGSGWAWSATSPGWAAA